MAKISEYDALEEWVDEAEFPLFDPTDVANPDKKGSLGLVRSAEAELENKTLGEGCAVGTDTDPVPAKLSTLAVDEGAATANSGNSYAVTIDKAAGLVTTDSLSTAAGGAQAITVNNALAAAGDIVMVTRNGGTSANGTPVLKAVAGAGTITITIDNKHASATFNGTFVIGFLLIKALA